MISLFAASSAAAALGLSRSKKVVGCRSPSPAWPVTAMNNNPSVWRAAAA